MDDMFNDARSFNQILSGDAWVMSNASQVDMLKGSSGSIPDYFSPRSRNELKGAVDALSPRGDSSTGQFVLIGKWDVSRVTDMRNMFADAKLFKKDLSKWDLRRVTRMQGMFFNARAFNGDVSKWDVSRVTKMGEVFSGAKSFNQDLSNWNVAQVDDMSWMFSKASAFNQDLSKWSVGKVIDMQGMFFHAGSFNQDLSNWSVAKVTNMDAMFSRATSFDRVMCGEAWVRSKASKRAMFDGSSGSISCDRFQPQNNNDLKSAVDRCLDRFVV